MKIKLLGIGKSEKHNHYTFPKRQEFFEIARSFLKELGFKDYEWISFGRPCDKKWREPLLNKENRINACVDERHVFGNEEYFIEIIFGKEKVFVLIHTEKDRQQKIANIMKKYIKK